MYQPPLYDILIRKLYFAARKRNMRMTTLLNAMVANALNDEPDPPPYEEEEQQPSSSSYRGGEKPRRSSHYAPRAFRSQKYR